MQQRSYFEALGQVLFRPAIVPGVIWRLANGEDTERAVFASIAEAHRVSIRCFRKLQLEAEWAGFRDLAAWAGGIQQVQTQQNAETVRSLHVICEELEQAGHPVVILKSLDHWPDLGSDVDVYAPAGDAAIAAILTSRFGARQYKRRMAGRLANQQTFSIPGMLKPLELHCGRLGRTGEHLELCRNMVAQTLLREIGPFAFRVLGREQSIVLTALQRMYYHLDIRFTDILNTAAVIEREPVDFERMKTLADSGCLWRGVATYLRNIHYYLESLRGFGLPIPTEIFSACAFGPDRLMVRDERLRVRVVPDACSLYARQTFEATIKGRAGQVLRLAWQPPLVAVKALREKASTQPFIAGLLSSFRRRRLNRQESALTKT
jgi:hypothetical protein